MFTSQDIANVVGGSLYGTGTKTVTFISQDSRALFQPEETAFFALHTTRRNGEMFLRSAYDRGVRVFVVQDKPGEDLLPGADIVVVGDALQALQTLAAYRRQQVSIPVVGITGSNGKTIVKEWLYQLLCTKGRVLRSPRSYNSQIGVPLSVWPIDTSYNLAIFEAGISRPGEMERLQNIIRPTIGVLTSLGDAHQENFTSLKAKCLSKIKLFSGAEKVVYCGDDKLVDICMQQEVGAPRLFSFGTGTGNNLVVLTVAQREGRSTVNFSYNGTQGAYVLPFADKASVNNSLACLSVLLCLGMPLAEALEGLATLEPVAMRLDVKTGLNHCTIIDDSYNSDLNSLAIALDFLTQEAAATGGRKTLILSDIEQSGLAPAELYQKVASMVSSYGVSTFIGVGPELCGNQSLIKAEDVHFFETTQDLLASVDSLALSSRTILLKGARHFKFEEVSNRLSTLVHETRLEVNLSALIENFNYFRQKLTPGTKICSMVKAFAYGCGDVEVARALQKNGCDYLAVAVADEGANLRNNGIHLPIVVCDPLPSAFAKMIEYNLEPEIYSFDLLRGMIAAARAAGQQNWPVHIKIDTGMHRLGFTQQDIPQLAEMLKAQQEVSPASVFSHFVGSDSTEFDYFTREQADLFVAVRQDLEARLGHKVKAHICNSAGIERFPEYHFDMVRLGIGHYGISAIDNRLLRPVCSLKTNILQIKLLDKTQTVGYSRRGTLEHDSVIGAIPIGYADGLNRHLGNRHGFVTINGQKAPIVGNICMDVCMIDLTGIDAREGDEVEVWGQSQTICDVADKLSTIPYEVLTSVSRRVKRVYFTE